VEASRRNLILLIIRGQGIFTEGLDEKRKIEICSGGPKDHLEASMGKKDLEAGKGVLFRERLEPFHTAEGKGRKDKSKLEQGNETHIYLTGKKGEAVRGEEGGRAKLSERM